MKKILKKLLAVFLYSALISFLHADPQITSVTMDPPNPGYGQEVTITVNYCAQLYMDARIAIAFSSRSDFVHAGTAGAGQVFVVSNRGVDVPYEVPATTPGGNIGWLANLANGPIAVPPCTDCVGSGGQVYSQQYVVHVPDSSFFESCMLSNLYLLVGMKDNNLNEGEWSTRTSCSSEVISFTAPVYDRAEIQPRSDGMIQDIGDEVVFSADYEYANSSYRITANMPSGGYLELVEFGPASITGGSVTAPAISATSGSFTWVFPNKTGVTGITKGSVYARYRVVSAPAAGTPFLHSFQAYNGTTYYNVAGQIVSGQPSISLLKSQSASSLFVNETVTYTLDYSINGMALKAHRDFDNITGGFYNSAPPAGWSFVPNNGTNGSWTVAEWCNTGDRRIMGAAGPAEYPLLALSGADADFCEGIVYGEAMISNTTAAYAGGDALVLIRQNNLTGTSGKMYGVHLSTDTAPSGGNISIQKCNGGTCTWNGAYSMEIKLNTWYSVKADVTSGSPYTFRVKVWPKGDPEPVLWHITWTDTSPVGMECTNGDTWTPGVGQMSGDNGVVRDYYDNIMIFEPKMFSDVVVYDTIPSGLSYLAANPAPSSVSPAVSWNLGNVSNASGTLTWMALATSCGAITNRAYIDGSDPAAPRMSGPVVLNVTGCPTAVPTITSTNPPSPTFTRTVTPTVTRTMAVGTGTFTRTVTPTSTMTRTMTSTMAVGTATFTVTVTPVLTVVTGCLQQDGIFNGGVVLHDYLTTSDNSYSMARDSGGRYILAGRSNKKLAVWRFFANGTTDTSFNGTGYVMLLALSGVTGGGDVNAANEVKIDAFGKIVVTGYAANSEGNYDMVLLRFNDNGSPDTTLNGSGKVIFHVPGESVNGMGLHLMDDGRIVVICSGTAGATVCRYNNNGTLDTALNTSGYVTFTGAISRSVTVDSADRIIFDNHTGTTGEIWRLNEDGTVDASFNRQVLWNWPPGGTVQKLMIDSSDRILGTGDYALYGVVFRLNSNGTFDTTFNSTGMYSGSFGHASPTYFYDIAEAQDGKIIGVGTGSRVTHNDVILFRLNSDGTPDTTVNGTGAVSYEVSPSALLDAEGWGAVIDPSTGRVVISGHGESADGDMDVLLAAFDDVCAAAGSPTATATPSYDLTAPVGTFTSTATPTPTRTMTATIPAGTATITRTITPFISPTPDDFTDGRIDIQNPGNNGSKDTCVDADGKIITVTLEWDDGCTCYTIVLYRYLPDGTLDNSFGTGGRLVCPGPVISTVFELNLTVRCDASGRILVGATTDPCGGTCADFIMYRFGSNGQPDNSFGGGSQCWRTYDNLAGGNGNDIMNSFEIDENGKIVCVGRSWNGTDYDMVMIRCNEDGTLDTSFAVNGCKKIHNAGGGNGYDCARKVVCSGGKYYVIGQSDSDDPGCTGICRVMCIWKFNQDGSEDTSFGPGGCVKYIDTANNHKMCVPNSIIITIGGKIVVTGYVTNGFECKIICKQMITIVLNMDGTFDTSFGTGGIITGLGGTEGVCVIETEGKLTIGMNTYNNAERDCMVRRYNMDGTQDMTFNGTGEWRNNYTYDDECTSILRISICKLLVSGSMYRPATGYDTVIWKIEDMCPSVTPTPTITPTMTPCCGASSINVRSGQTGDSCSAGGPYYIIRVENTGVGPVSTDTLKLRMWFNSMANPSVSSMNVTHYTSMAAVGNGTSFTVISPCMMSPDRQANRYMEVTFSASVLAPGEYLHITFGLLGGVPFDPECDDYSRIDTSSVVDRPYICLYENNVLVTEQTSYGVADPLTGVEPCSIPAGSPTFTRTATRTLTVTPTPTMTVTRTATPTFTRTVTPFFTMTATPTATLCNGGVPPAFTVEMIFNPENLDYDVFEITSSVPLVSAPDITVYPHGGSINKPPLTLSSTLIPGETMKYRALYPKTTGFGDVDTVTVEGTDLCGEPGSYTGKFDKSVISKRDVVPFSNVFNPDKGGRVRYLYNVYGGTKVKISVYSRTGALITTLFDGVQTQARQYEITWDGKNSEGKTVASGTYVVVFETDYYTVKEKTAVTR